MELLDMLRFMHVHYWYIKLSNSRALDRIGHAGKSGLPVMGLAAHGSLPVGSPVRSQVGIKYLSDRVVQPKLAFEPRLNHALDVEQFLQSSRFAWWQT